MTINEVLILCCIGLGAGVFSGLIGIGGGIIMIPCMVYLLGMSQLDAQGTSLAVMLPPIGFMAVWKYYQEGYVNIWAATIIGITFFIGGYFGGLLAVKIDQNLLKKIFGVVLLIVGLKTLFGK